MTSTPEQTGAYRGVPAPEWIGDDWDTLGAAAWKDGVDAALGGRDPATLWQRLADTLNAIVAAGQFPDLHNLKGPRNGRQHQPYITDDAQSGAPWVLLDTATGRFVVTTRERALDGEHSRPRPGSF